LLLLVIDPDRSCSPVIASEAKQSMQREEEWIASSLRSSQ
jgi:hypothetical protein